MDISIYKFLYIISSMSLLHSTLRLHISFRTDSLRYREGKRLVGVLPISLLDAGGYIPARGARSGQQWHTGRSCLRALRTVRPDLSESATVG